MVVSRRAVRVERAARNGVRSGSMCEDFAQWIDDARSLQLALSSRNSRIRVSRNCRASSACDSCRGWIETASGRN